MLMKAAGQAALLIVLVLLSGEGFPFPSGGGILLFVGVADAQLCKQVSTNTNSTNTNTLKSVPQVAQRLDVKVALNVLHFTAVFPAPSPQPITLRSVQLYNDAADGLTPRTPLLNGTFDTTGVPTTTGTTYFRFNSTEPGGIPLANGTSYWLVLAFNDTYRQLQGFDVANNTARPLSDLVELGGQVMVGSGESSMNWTKSAEVMALSIDIYGCVQLSPYMSTTPAPSSSPSASAAAPPSPTRSPSPSASRAPAVSPLAAAIEVLFNAEEPTFDISVPSIPGTEVGGSFLGLTVDSSSLDLRPYDVSVVNTTVGGTDNPVLVETHTYSTLLADNATTFAQIFAYYEQAVQGAAFDTLDLTIRPNTVKWSLNITTSSDNASALGQQPFSVSYKLAAAATAMATVIKRRGEPRANMTTYQVYLTSPGKPLVAVVEVFDVALADGQLVPLVSHDVRLVTSSPLREQEVFEYELVLEFAPFNWSLYYDPSLGLGVLLGRADTSSSGGDDNLALVVATSVIIPLAFVLVVGAVVVGVTALWWRKRRANAHLQQQIDQMRDNNGL